MKKKKIVITGLGIVSALGCNIEKFWQNLLAGQSGISPITAFAIGDFGYKYAGEIKCFQPQKYLPAEAISKYGKAAQYAIAAAKAAGAEHPQLSAKKTAVCIGVTTGEAEAAYQIVDKKNVPPINNLKKLYSQYPVWRIAESINEELKLNGPVYTFPMACSAGNHALIRGIELIQNGAADQALVGGSEALSFSTYAGFIKLRSMAAEMVQPFDRNRQGILIGEGSGMLLLEEKEQAQRRGAKIYGEIVGYGLNCEAYHITTPHPAGLGMSKAITSALKMAKIAPEKIDYINAHGTGTKANDLAETMAIKKALGPAAAKTPVSSIKSMLGHCMGSASAIEAIACCLALRDNMIPPTINYQTPDPSCDLDYVPNQARAKKLKIVLSNAFAFGGNNTAIIIRKINDE